MSSLSEGTTVDPVRYLRAEKRQVGLDDGLDYYAGRVTWDMNDSLCRLYSSFTKVDDTIYIRVNHKGKRHDQRSRLPESLLRKLTEVYPPESLREIPAHETATLSIFYYPGRPAYNYEGYDPAEAVLHIAQPSPGQYVVQGFGSGRARSRLPWKFQDLRVASPSDYRPYLRRMVELHAGLRREKWQDPARYLQELAVRDSTPFAAQELLPERMLVTLRDHELKLRGEWPSVPRMSLGATRLPEPEVSVVMDAAPYLVERLAELNILDADAAVALISSRLTQYLLRQGFQLNRENAAKVICMLERDGEAAPVGELVATRK
jgi:hypothetical protein